MPTNALIHEKSPYLRQHAQNPVDWMPWGEAAFAKARAEDKPIFVSIGYSTCHWCHVMAHESFESDRVAAVLNRDFVPVKVDREERPDVDRIYMLFVQATTGSGGWPMSVWLTPELKPFFGGTYFAPDQRYGRPGFVDILNHLSQAWKNEREKVEESGRSVTEQLAQMSATAKSPGELGSDLLDTTFWQFRRSFDAEWGGFGHAPKFPRPVVLNYLLRYYARENSEDALDMVAKTLSEMEAGGMHDQLGGGFHRYSVDERWFVPHFEKMLYDQAQLAIAYLEAFQITGAQTFAQTARGIFEYVVRDLTDPAGGFYSAEDADSPEPDDPSHSGEGAFYIWSKQEIAALLPPPVGERFSQHFGVEEGGNVQHDPHGEFIGRNILYRAVRDKDDTLEEAKQILFAAREKRPRPHLDNKILTSWNGLMISALAKGYVVLGDHRYAKAAERAANFLLTTMYDAGSGQLSRRYCDGEPAISAFLDDYAFFAQALLDLFEATFDPGYLREAINLARGFGQFEDKENGGFFSTRAGESDLLVRMKDDYDGAEPSGNSVATDVCLRLAHLTGGDAWKESADRALRSFASKLRAQPTMAPQMSVALDRWLAVPEQLVIRCETVDEEVERRIGDARKHFSPHAVQLALTDAAAQALADIAPFLATLERHERLTIYECRNFTCALPEVVA